MIEAWRSVARLLQGTHRMVIASVAISVAQSALLVPIAFIVRRLFDVTIPDGRSSELVVLGLVILMLFVSGSALGFLTGWLSLRATKESIRRLQARLLEQLLYTPKAFFDRADLGGLHSIVVQDSLRVDMMANSIVSILIPSVVVGLALGVTMIFLNPLLGGLILIAAPVMIVSGRRLNRRVRARARLWYDAIDEFSGQTHHLLRAVTLTKLHGAERIQLEQRGAELETLRRTGFSLGWWQNLYPQTQTLVSATLGLIVLVVGGLAVADGRMSLGDLISFYAILGLLRTQLSGSLFSIPQVIAGMESLERLERLLEDRATEPYSGTRRLGFQRAIALEDVSFEYRPGEPVLQEVSLEVARGEVVALCGPNGAGKSTILSLIAGLYAPTEGRVLVDDVPLAEVDIMSLRRSIGVVVQDPLIFPSSVRENVAFGSPEATLPEVEATTRRAGADEFIRELPDGLETRVGDDGVRLSGGQRQKIALARALLGDPALLLLDEPTTYLDEESVERLMTMLLESSSRPAVMIISHDAAILDRAERVIRLRAGAVELDAATPAGVELESG